ncbi:MAG: NAD(P)H-dependent oxidoreductase [Saprospiraceae bacterium]
MPHIAIISASVRLNRVSHRVALYFQQYIQEQLLGTVEILDLKAYNFPVFEERLHLQPDPSAAALDFAEKIKKADGVLIVTPEYNGGYPASLKNVVDLLYDEWRRKPVAISTVSNGAFGGTQVITALQFSLWKIRAWTVPAMFPVPKAQDTFDEAGHPAHPEDTNKRAAGFLSELLWCIAAKQAMEKG